MNNTPNTNINQDTQNNQVESIDLKSIQFYKNPKDNWEEVKHITKTYKKPKDFIKSILNNNCEIIKGTQLNKKDFVDGKYPFYNGGLNPSGYINNYNNENALSISEGGASAGNINYVKGKFWSGGHNYVLKNLNIHQDYLYFTLNNNQKRLLKLQKGSALPNINKTELEKFWYFLTENKLEQKLIASILTSQEELISSKKELLEKYKQQRKYFQQELLSGRLRLKLNTKAMGEALHLDYLKQYLLNAENEVMEYGTDKVENIKIEIVEDKKEEFENWLNVDFQNKIEFYKNGKLNWKSEKINGRIVDIPLDWINEQLQNLLDYEHSNNYIVKDVDYKDIYNIPVLTAGKTFILGYTNEDFGIFNKGKVIIFDDFTTATQLVDFKFKVKSGAMKILKLKNNLINIELISKLMKKIKWDTTNHKRYWISEFSKLKLSLPSTIQEQTLIATHLTKCDNLIENLETEITQEEKKFTFLKQELLSGRIRVR